VHCTLLGADSNSEIVNNTNCIRPANRTVSRWRIIRQHKPTERRQLQGFLRFKLFKEYNTCLPKANTNNSHKQTNKQPTQAQNSMQFSHSSVCSQITLHYELSHFVTRPEGKQDLEDASVNGNIILK